ncbi:alpha/beta fold hydrolase [Oscillatoria acuminata]|nr:alpha/beta fold hydrolase [Oscillatoria acuminata]
MTNDPTLTMRSQPNTPPNTPPLGAQRDWIWRGYQIRYTYIRSPQAQANAVPLIFLHGFGSSLGQWRFNLRPISEYHTIYALDFLGFGASEKASANYRVSLWAELVYDFWRSFIAKPAVVIGHSLGALIALTTVATYPQMTQGLVMLTLPDPQPRQPPAWARAIEQFFSSPLLLWPLFKIVRQPGLLRSVLRKIYQNPDLVDDELVELFATPARDRGALKVFYRLSLTRSDPEYSPIITDLLPGLTLPILLLWGEADQIVPFRSAMQLANLNSHIQLVTIPDAGHVVYDESPEFVNQAIVDWVESAIE